MNEDKELEEVIKYIENIINATYITATLKDKDGDIIEEGLVNQQVIQDLLDLYNKEKQEKNYLIENSIPKKKIEDKRKEINNLKNRKYTIGTIIAIDSILKKLLEDK